MFTTPSPLTSAGQGGGQGLPAQSTPSPHHCPRASSQASMVVMTHAPAMQQAPASPQSSRILMAPVIAIAKGYFHKILDAVQEAVILGVHAQGRDGWPQERIDRLFEESMRATGFDQFAEDLSRRRDESLQNGESPNASSDSTDDTVVE